MTAPPLDPDLDPDLDTPPNSPPEVSFDAPFNALLALVQNSGLAYVLHEHAPTRTIEEARANLTFDVERIVKTVAFTTRGGRLVLAALRGTRRVDYARLAALVGVSRRDLCALAPQEVLERLGVAPGSVSPLSLGLSQGLSALEPEGALRFFDEEALSIQPTVYCGTGRPDRTLEMAAADLLRLCGARPEALSR